MNLNNGEMEFDKVVCLQHVLLFLLNLKHSLHTKLVLLFRIPVFRTVVYLHTGRFLSKPLPSTQQLDIGHRH